ncbi:MAG: hypothetical protein WC113_00345 [Candidatus Paceibacterota bacterium]
MKKALSIVVVAFLMFFAAGLFTKQAMAADLDIYVSNVIDHKDSTDIYVAVENLSKNEKQVFASLDGQNGGIGLYSENPRNGVPVFQDCINGPGIIRIGAGQTFYLEFKISKKSKGLNLVVEEFKDERNELKILTI